MANRDYSTDDQSSLSNPTMAISTNLHLDWTLDFQKKIITGTCKHSITVLIADTETVDFDSSKLNITSVLIDGVIATFKIAPLNVQLGSKVSVTIPKVTFCLHHLCIISCEQVMNNTVTSTYRNRMIVPI